MKLLTKRVRYILRNAVVEQQTYALEFRVIQTNKSNAKNELRNFQNMQPWTRYKYLTGQTARCKSSVLNYVLIKSNVRVAYKECTTRINHKQFAITLTHTGTKFL